MKTYYETRLQILLSWPKTTLWGNTFRYTTDGGASYFEEYRCKSKSSIKRFFAYILYPFLNPLALFLSRKREKSSPIDLARKAELKAYKKTLQRLAEEPCNDPVAERQLFLDTERDIHIKWNELKTQINTIEDWESEDIKQKFNALFERSAQNFSHLIKALKSTLNRENLHTNEAIAARIVAQWDEPNFCYALIYSTLIEMYHSARSKLLIKKWRDDITYPELLKNAHIHQNARAFYEQDKPEFEWRQRYNTSIKLLLRECSPQKGLHEAFKKADQRFFAWTKKDSKKNEDFRPYPDTRPT